MGQAPKFLHITQIAKLKIKKNHSKSSTHNPTSQILKKSQQKPIMGQAPKFHTRNPTSQILPKSMAKTLIPLNIHE